MATGALVLGILALLFGLLLGWVPVLGIAFGGLGVILGIIGVILGIIARKRPTGTGQATTGLVLSAIGAIAAIGWAIAWIVGVGGMADEIEQELEDAIDEAGAEFEEELDGDLDDLEEAFEEEFEEAAEGENRLGDREPPFTPYDGEDAPAFEDVRSQTYEVDDFVFTDVEVLSDSFDDYLIRADVEHVGDEAGDYQITAWVVADGEDLGQASTAGALAPGEQVEVHLDGVSSFDPDYDSVEFMVD